LHMHKLHEWSKTVLWQRFWLDLCTKQVVSARACANQFLPYNSPGIKLIDMRAVQADSCLNSEKIDTLFISVGGQEGDLGGGWSFWAGGPKSTRDCYRFFVSLLHWTSFSSFSPAKRKIRSTVLVHFGSKFPFNQTVRFWILPYRIYGIKKEI